jgi:hypothetical protein
MDRKNLENFLDKVKENYSKYYSEINNMSKSLFLDKKVKFKNTEIVNDEVKNNICEGVITDVTVTTDCDLMIEVRNTKNDETKIIFSHNVLETEK